MGIYLLFMFMPVIVFMPLLLIYKSSVYSSDKAKRRYLFICGMFLFLMLACKHYSVGSGDGKWYYENWKYMSSVTFGNLFKVIDSFDMEKGYLLCVWLLSHIFENPQFVFIFYGLLVAVAVCRFLYKNCENVVLGFVMFNCLGLWGFMVQGIRQGIAMCVCLFAIEYCNQRRLIPFILVVSLAMTFHASAISFLVVYIFVSLTMDLKSYILVAIYTVIAVVLMDEIYGLINYVINDSYLIGSTDNTSGGFVSAAIYILILIVAMLFFKGKNFKQKNIALFFYMTWCGFITFMMRYNINTIIQRISYYYMFGQMIVLPSNIERLGRKDRALVYLLTINLCFGIAIYKATYSELIPYWFFWQR